MVFTDHEHNPAHDVSRTADSLLVPNQHGDAMHLLQRGTDVSLITRWLGHQNLATMHNHARAYRVLSDCSAAGVRNAEAVSARSRASESLLEFLKAL